MWLEITYPLFPNFDDGLAKSMLQRGNIIMYLYFFKTSLIIHIINLIDYSGLTNLW